MVAVVCAQIMFFFVQTCLYHRLTIPLIMLQKPTQSPPPSPPCHLSVSLSNLKLSPRGVCKYLARPLFLMMSTRMQRALSYFLLAPAPCGASETALESRLFLLHELLPHQLSITFTDPTFSSKATNNATPKGHRLH